MKPITISVQHSQILYLNNVTKHNNHVTMKTKKNLLLILFLLFESISGKDVCSPAFCSLTGPQVRFPFRIVDRQPSQCGFPGFDLSCNEKNQTVLKLPSSRSFIVTSISYAAQVINLVSLYINITTFVCTMLGKKISFYYP